MTLTGKPAPATGEVRDDFELGYKPGKGKGTGFRTVIIDGILPGTPFRDLPHAVLHDLEARVPKDQLVSATLLNTTGISSAQASTIRLEFFQAKYAVQFVDSVKDNGVQLAGQECRVTLLQSPTYPMPGSKMDTISRSGVSRILLIRNKPTKLSAAGLLDALLSDVDGVSDMNGPYGLRKGVVHDLRLHDDGTIEILFDTLDNSMAAFQACRWNPALRQCWASYGPRPKCDDTGKSQLSDAKARC